MQNLNNSFDTEPTRNLSFMCLCI